MATKMRLEGMRDVQRAMFGLKRATAKGVARKVLKNAGKPVAETGAALAPKREGHLADSYGVGTKLTKRQARLNRKKDPVEVYVGPNDPAAIQTEFGNRHQAAEPHLRPAWNAKRDEALEIVKTELWDDVQKSLARAAKRKAKAGR